jgi:hypothetical protein
MDYEPSEKNSPWRVFFIKAMITKSHWKTRESGHHQGDEDQILSDN